MELELAIKAAGGLDADHGILGGTLPSDRSPLRGNRFPAPSAYRQDREPAEAAHALAGEVGLRQAAKRLSIHRDALKAAFGQWRRPALARRVGWQPSRFLVDRAEAERVFPRPIRRAESWTSCPSRPKMHVQPSNHHRPGVRRVGPARQKPRRRIDPVEGMEVAALGGCTLGP